MAVSTKPGKSILTHMSAAIAVLTEERGACTERDLLALGFTGVQLLQFGADATARANRAMIRRGRPLSLIAEAS